MRKYAYPGSVALVAMEPGQGHRRVHRIRVSVKQTAQEPIYKAHLKTKQPFRRTN